MYEKDCGRSKVKLCKRWQSQDWHQENDAVCVVGLERNSLWATATWSNNWF